MQTDQDARAEQLAPSGAATRLAPSGPEVGDSHDAPDPDDSEPASGQRLPGQFGPLSLRKRKSEKKAGHREQALRAVQEQLRQLCVALFLQDEAPIRSLGVTSALNGEGKSLLAATIADILADDIGLPVTLVECNWDHPSFDKHFDIATSPGLAEWLRGEVALPDIRHQLRNNLTIIPAGQGRNDAVRLMLQLQPTGIAGLLGGSDEIVIADLPPIVSCAYGTLAASLVESLILVVRAGKTPESAVADASAQLAALPVAGVILNQVESRIPRWLQQLL